MRRISTTIVLALVTLLLVSICEAQQTSTTAVPNLVRYGGTLKDANGAPVASTTDVTFSMYKQQDGGAPVWMETQNVISDSGGNYNVLLGSTTTTGLPSDLFSQDEQRWLGVQVQGQAEQPRVLLVSVPYALKAHEAETLAGKSISDFVLAKDVNASNSAAGVGASSGSGSTQATAGNGNQSASKWATLQGPTNFSGTTFDQIVGVTQLGSGAAVVASTSTAVNSNAVLAGINGPGVAILGQAHSTSAQAYGVQGTSASNIGIGLLGFATAATGPTYGLKGYSSSTSGTGLRGLSTATTGYTIGVSASVASPQGTAASLNNTAGGNIIIGQNNGTSVFSVDGSGNINTTSGAYRLSGRSVLSIGRPADNNLFVGVNAGFSDIAGQGQYNVFLGYLSGYSNTMGGGNTFSGPQAGYSNTTGGANTFSGYAAGYANTTGHDNTFIGNYAGSYITTGTGNTLYGSNAGVQNYTGNYNIALGFNAGLYSAGGSNNIYIGNVCYPYPCVESSTIRIGGDIRQGYGPQTAAYIAGIYSSTATPTPPFQAVCVDPNGTLFGTTPGTSCAVSSLRFKEQIGDMGDSSSRLFQLHPVIFFYKPQYDDGSHSLQYGLIAEEVAKVYPELVAYDKDGQPYTVKYQYLAPMLLNELQKQHIVVAAQQGVIKTQQEQIDDMRERLLRLERLVGAR